MTSWVKRIENEQKRLRTAAFGWLFKDELTEAGRHGFAYGGKAFHTDGTVGMSGHVDRATMEAYTPKGSEQYIHDLFGVMTEQHNPGLEVLVAAAFAGPLMYVTGEKNAILWATSNETGIGKSTSIMTGMGVWCAPERAKENATASLLSIQDRLGTLRNLTLFVDEIALQAQVEALAKNVNVFTEGTAGGKLDQNRNQRDKKPWQSILVVGSNQSVRDYFCKVNKTSPSSLARALEMRVRPTSGVRTLPGDDVMRKVENLNRNFGHIGLRYSEFLAKNHERILTDGMALIKDFKESVGFRDGERFWMALCVTILLGAALANELMGKDYFHVAEMREYLTAVYMDNRKFIEENTDEGASFYNTYDVLTAFLKSIPDHQLWTLNMQMGRGRQAVTILHRYNGINPKPVHVHWCTDQRLLRISQTAFLHFLEDRPVPLSPTPIRMGLREQFGAKFDVTRVNLVAGTKIIAQNPETVIEIPIPANSLLEGSLFAYDVDGNAAPYTVAPGDQNVTVTTSADALAIAAATGAADLAVARGTSAP